MEDRPVSHAPPRKATGPRIFVDCTQTVRTSNLTGIPRVVTNIVKHGRPAARERGADLVPVRFRKGRFVTTAVSADDDLYRPKKYTANLPTNPFLRRLHKLLVPRSLMRFVQKRIDARLLSGIPVKISARDILLLPDSPWQEPIWDAVDQALSEGATLGIVQHDFIPLEHPELVPPENTEIFRRWADATLQRAHFMMAVSETVAAAARDRLTKLGRRDVAERCVTAFRNGADLPPPTTIDAIRQELIEFLGPAGHGPYVTVGTIEPRKNQSTLLAAISQVLARAPDARFLIAGVVGWNGKPIAESIRQHPGWPSNVRHFSDLTDAELRFAYKHAKAVVFPSLAEGYGLPIVESLANGTRVFASDIPVHREIGEPHCVFFDPLDASQLADVLTGHALHGEYPAKWPPSECNLPTWREAAIDIVETSLAHARRAISRPSRQHDQPFEALLCPPWSTTP